jgi:hypothetical protein
MLQLLQKCLRALIVEKAIEEVASTIKYPDDYVGPPNIDDQLATLRKYFPDVGDANKRLIGMIKNGKKPENDHANEDRGYWCIPHWSALGSTYSEAIDRCIAMIKHVHGDAKVIDETHDCLKESHILQTQNKVRIMDILHKKQNAMTIIIEAQFGIRHRGRSSNYANRMMPSREYSLGIYENLIMLLLCPQRLSDNALGIDAAGDQFRTNIADKFDKSLHISQRGGRLIIGYDDSRLVSENYGASSFFV